MIRLSGSYYTVSVLEFILSGSIGEVMPKLWERQGASNGDRSPWFVKISNRSPPPPTYTFQLEPAGIRILHGMGLSSGDVFDHQQFWTLHDLGLSYTLGEDDNPSLSRDLSEEDADDIPPNQQALFVRELLEGYPVAEIRSEGFYRLLQGIEEGPDEARFELLEFMLSKTPIEYPQPDGLATDNDPVFKSSVFGALVCRAFSEFLEGSSGFKTSYCEPIAHQNDYVYLITEKPALNLTPELAEFNLDIPQFFLDAVLPSRSEAWEIDVIEEIHMSQFLGDGLIVSHTIGTTLYNGLDESHGIVIVPKQLLDGVEVDRTFDFGN